MSDGRAPATEGQDAHAARPDPPVGVVVAGAAGRLGRVACAALLSRDDLRLAARLLRGDDPAPWLAVRPSLVVLDVSVAEATRELGPRAARAGLPVVVGTSGLDTRDDECLDAAARAGGVAVLRVPNFSLGAVLQIRAAELVARHLACLGIDEVHHVHKKDAPSGTSLHTAARIAAARAATGDACSPRITSARREGVLAEQRISFGDDGELLRLEHVVSTRTAYVPGILLALRRVGRLAPGLHVGLESVLDVD